MMEWPFHFHGRRPTAHRKKTEATVYFSGRCLGFMLAAGLFLLGIGTQSAVAASWPTTSWRVRCEKKDANKLITMGECDRTNSTSAVEYMEVLLKQISEWYEAQGFKQPALPLEYGLWGGTYIYAGYIKDREGKVDGYYNYGTKKLYISETTHFTFGTGNDSKIPFTIPAHELFHAIQYSYKPFQDGNVPDWITEGTANAAGEVWGHSYVSEQGTEYNRRYDRPLNRPDKQPQKDNSGAYGTSSFWGWLAASKDNDSFGYLTVIFTQPDLTQAQGLTGVDAGFRRLGWGGLFRVYPQFIAWLGDQVADYDTFFGQCVPGKLGRSYHKHEFHVRTVREVAADCYKVRVKIPPQGSYELLARIRNPTGEAAKQLHIIMNGQVIDGVKGAVWLDKPASDNLIFVANVAHDAEKTTPQQVVLDVELRPIVWHASATGVFDGNVSGGVARISLDKGERIPSGFPVFGVKPPPPTALGIPSSDLLEINLLPYKSLADYGKSAIDLATAGVSGDAGAIRKLTGIREIYLYLAGISKIEDVKTGRYKAYIRLDTSRDSYEDVADFFVPSAPLVPDITIGRPLTGTITLTKASKGAIQGSFTGRLVVHDALDRVFDGHSCPGAQHWGVGMHYCRALEVHLSGRFQVNVQASLSCRGRMAMAVQMLSKTGLADAQKLLSGFGVTPDVACDPGERSVLLQKMQRFPPGARGRGAGPAPDSPPHGRSSPGGNTPSGTSQGQSVSDSSLVGSGKLAASGSSPAPGGLASFTPPSGASSGVPLQEGKLSPGHGHLQFGKVSRDFKIDACSFQNVPGMGRQVSVQTNASDLRVMISSASMGPDGEVQMAAVILGVSPSAKTFQLSRMKQGGIWRSESGQGAAGPVVQVDGRHVSVHGTFSETAVGIRREVVGSIEAVCGG
jgi:hypothetical protein